MKGLAIGGAAVLGGVAGLALVIFLVAACTVVLGPSDVGMGLAIAALFGGGIAGAGLAGTAVAKRSRPSDPPPPGSGGPA